MSRIFTALAIVLALGACEPRSSGGGSGGPSTASTGAPELPRSIQYNTPQGAQTYVLPTTENACAPEPQRFVSTIGEVTYRVKDCVKDEYDYYPESQRIRIQALVNQCRSKCGGR